MTHLNETLTKYGLAPAPEEKIQHFSSARERLADLESRWLGETPKEKPIEPEEEASHDHE